MLLSTLRARVPSAMLAIGTSEAASKTTTGQPGAWAGEAAAHTPAAAAAGAIPPAPARGITTEAQQDRFIGAYTPVTKQLWAQRLQWHTQQDGEAAAGAPAGPRAPEATAVVYPFTSDAGLAECYANPWRGIRIGRLLEDLDSLAGSVALRHCAVPGQGAPHLVTAGVDAIHLRRPLSLDHDMSLEGRVVWTGRSSLDIRMEVSQPGAHAPGAGASLVAVFSFVSLTPDCRAREVPQLAQSSDREREWFGERAAVAEARKAQRVAAVAAGGAVAVPAEVQARLDELVAAAGLVRDMPALAPPHDMLMSQTSLANTFTCQPQQRNPRGRVFGGFLLRRAFELAFATCYTFAGSRPKFDSVDDVAFKRPVDVGDLMRLRSCVLHAEGDRVVVVVEAAVVKPEQMASHPTNSFTFVFRAAPGGEQQQLRRVLPGDAGDLQRLRTYLAEAAA